MTYKDQRPSAIINKNDKGGDTSTGTNSFINRSSLITIKSIVLSIHREIDQRYKLADYHNKVYM
jgi:uncharacterized protein involved in tellurium resistance